MLMHLWLSYQVRALAQSFHIEVLSQRKRSSVYFGGCDWTIRPLTLSADLSIDKFQFGQLYWEVKEVSGRGDWLKERHRR